MFKSVVFLVSFLLMSASVADAARGYRARAAWRPKRTVVKVRVAPPVPATVVVRRPARPGPAYVWRSGDWVWRDGGWRWGSGAWVMPPRAGVVWVPGTWQSGIWVAGYWR